MVVVVLVVVVVVFVVVVYVVFSSDQGWPALWLVAEPRRGNINVLGNKTHLSTAAAFPLQTTATHKVGQELQSRS